MQLDSNGAWQLYCISLLHSFLLSPMKLFHLSLKNLQKFLPNPYSEQMSYFDNLSKKISTSSQDIILPTCPHVIYRSSCSLPSICVLSPSLYTIHYPFFSTQRNCSKNVLSFLYHKTFFPYQIISTSYYFSLLIKKKNNKSTFSPTSLSATALSSFLHKITSTSIYHDSCSLHFIIKYWFNY